MNDELDRLVNKVIVDGEPLEGEEALEFMRLFAAAGWRFGVRLALILIKLERTDDATRVLDALLVEEDAA